MERKTFDSLYMKKMHKKIMFFALIVMIIPMVIQIVISSTAAMQERRIRISELNEQYLTGTSSVFSLIVNQINDYYLQGMANNSVKFFEDSYMGRRYEAAKAEGKFTDWKNVYLYLAANTGIVYEIGLSRIADSIHDIPRQLYTYAGTV